MPVLDVPDLPEPELLRGSLITLRRRCGTASCHCATGDPHESPALSYSVDGKTTIVTVHDDDVEAVTAALARYRTARAELEEGVAAGVEVLRARTAARRSRAGRR